MRAGIEPLIHIVDDDRALRDATQILLASIGLEATGYATASAFLEHAETTRPGCVLLDLRIPDMSGLEVQRLLQTQNRPKPVIFLTGYGDVEVTVRAMRQGALEFLTKPVRDELLLQKVRNAIELSKRERADSERRASVRARLKLLSPREAQVLDGVVEGRSNKEIARRLQISHKTVELHRHNMMVKMRAGSIAEVVRMRIGAAGGMPSTQSV